MPKASSSTSTSTSASSSSRSTRRSSNENKNPNNLRLATPPPPQRLRASERVELDSRFHSLVYEAVRTIPEGRVSSYGRIAQMIGHPKHSRHVGSALKLLPPHLSSPYLPQRRRSLSTGDQQQEEDEVLAEPESNPDFVPWHRVLSSSGQISPRMNDVSVRRQADWLRAEGVDVIDPDHPDVPNAVVNGIEQGFGLNAVNSGGKVSMSRYAWP